MPVGALVGPLIGVLPGCLPVHRQGHQRREEVVVTPSTDAPGLVGVDLVCVARLVA